MIEAGFDAIIGCKMLRTVKQAKAKGNRPVLTDEMCHIILG